jgi:hypothetical protein
MQRLKVERKQDAKWAAEQAARERLMADVVEERARQIQNKCMHQEQQQRW